MRFSAPDDGKQAFQRLLLRTRDGVGEHKGHTWSEISREAERKREDSEETLKLVKKREAPGCVNPLMFAR